MNATAMMDHISEPSPQLKARLAGVFWLLTALAGTFSLLARGGPAGVAANVAATLCYLVATLLVYELLRPVDGRLSLLAALFSLMGCASGIAMMALSLPAEAANISRISFGLHCFLVGYLILRSTFLPRIVGWVMILAGLGWMTRSFLSFLAPPLGQALSPYLMGAGIFGEMCLTLWLLIAGVNVQRWKEQARAAAQG